ncbi:MAG: hypothetical protein FWH20_04765 [Oscillospiraceae bacterium]|nr:hypothetical protein [Oscillospiraceae bacterium]
MKKFISRFIALLITLALLLAMTAVMPITASAEAVDYTIYVAKVGDKHILNRHATQTQGYGPYTDNEGKWEFDEDTMTLWLKDGFNFETTAAGNPGINVGDGNNLRLGNVTIKSGTEAIRMSGGNLIVDGTAVITTATIPNNTSNSVVLNLGNGHTTISGNGTLTVTSGGLLSGSAIYNNSGGLTIEGDVTVNASGPNTTGNSSGISMTSGNGNNNLIIKDNARVTATGGSIENSSSYGISLMDDIITITDFAEVTATGGNAENSTGSTSAVYSYGIYSQRGILIEKDAKVTATGGSVTGISTYSAASSYGFYCYGTNDLVIKDRAEVTGIGGTSTSPSTALSIGIASNSKVIISDTAKVTGTGGTAQTTAASQNGSQSYGIGGNNSGISISGSPTVTATGGAVISDNENYKASAGIRAGYHSDAYLLKVEIDGGKITAKGDTHAINSLSASAFIAANAPVLDLPDDYGVFGINSRGKYTIPGIFERVNILTYSNWTVRNDGEIIKDLIIFTADEDINCDEGHSFGGWAEILEVTNTYKAVDEQTCTVCGEKQFRGREPIAGFDSRECGVDGYECGLRTCEICAPVCGVDGYECGLRACEICAPVCGEDGYKCNLITCEKCNTQPPKTGLGDYRGFVGVVVVLVGTSAALWLYSRRRKN